MDDQDAEGRGQQRPLNGPRNPQNNPQCANYWAVLTRKRQEHGPQRLSERSDPTQHVKGTTGAFPGPCKEAAARRNVTRGGGGIWLLL